VRGIESGGSFGANDGERVCHLGSSPARISAR
jgi:hypothetical protein